MINLGDKKWGVKDSGLLAYKQVGSRFFNKDFEFSRASNGTYVGKDGLLKTAELYNKIDYSQDFSQWTTIRSSLGETTISPNGVLNATGLIASTDNNDHFINKGISVTSGVEYTFSAFIKLGDTDKTWVRLWNTIVGYVDFNLSDGSIGTTSNATGFIVDSGNGWYRCAITFTANVTAVNAHRIYIMDGDNDRTFIGDGVSNYIYIFGAQLVEGTEPLDYQYTNGLDGIPRIDYSDDVGALLLEPQRTNSITYSEDFTQWLVVNTPTITENYGISPDGTNNSTRIQFDFNDRIYLPVSLSGDITYSLYLKGSGIITIRENTNVHLLNITLTDQWVRYNLSFNSTITSVQIQNQGSESVDLEVWGAQVEQGTYSTSYIKSNSGSTTTRLADVANNCGSEQDFNSEEGVLYAEIAAFLDDLTFRIISISDGTTSNRVILYYTNVSEQIRGAVVSGTSVVAFLNYISDDITDFYKIAVKYKENDFALWINGVKVAADTSGAAPVGLSELAFDDAVGASPFYGKVRSVKYFPTALSDTELQNLTT